VTTPTTNPFSLTPSSPASSGTRVPVDAAAQRDFAEILGIANRLVKPAETDPRTEARAAAEQFVAQVLVQPMLAEVRNASTEPPPFGPGPGEKQFGSLIDAQRAVDMVRGSRWSIVDRIASDIERATRRGAPRPDGAAATARNAATDAAPASPVGIPDTRRMSFTAAGL
jgi:Rod binding domain-containing protein